MLWLKLYRCSTSGRVSPGLWLLRNAEKTLSFLRVLSGFFLYCAHTVNRIVMPAFEDILKFLSFVSHLDFLCAVNPIFLFFREYHSSMTLVTKDPGAAWFSLSV